jgi:hypothetical protein
MAGNGSAYCGAKQDFLGLGLLMSGTLSPVLCWHRSRHGCLGQLNETDVDLGKACAYPVNTMYRIFVRRPAGPVVAGLHAGARRNALLQRGNHPELLKVFPGRPGDLPAGWLRLCPMTCYR